MSSQTTNLHLVKPADNEVADIDVINDNMDTIDSAVQSLRESVYHECGNETVSNLSAGESRDVRIDFAHTFPSIPGVMLCFGYTSSSGASLLDVTAQVISRSTTGFTMRVYKQAGGNVVLSWLAIA